jgi:hypothetical protein
MYLPHRLRRHFPRNLYDILFSVKKGRGDDQVGLYESACGKGESNGLRQKRRKWRAGEAVLSGVVDVVIATVGYLLCVFSVLSFVDRDH